MRGALRGMLSRAWPTLRVVALVYTGLSGIAVLVVVISAAMTPRPQVLHEVTEPAREPVTARVQPGTDMVTRVVSAPAAPSAPVQVVTARPTPAPFVDITSLDVVIDAAPSPAPVVQPVVVERAQPGPRIAYLAPAPEVVDDGQPGADDDQAVDDSADDSASASDSVAVGEDLVVDAPALQEAATAAQSQPLPTPTVVIPTTSEQVKAQVDAANQAAIDAAKASAAQTKAQADAANQAAIDAAKAAKAKH